MKQLANRFLLVALSVIAGALLFQLLSSKVNAQQCPAACGQTWPGYYLCECAEFGINPYTGERECLRQDCAWTDGCCSKCDETQCCGAAVGGGTGCGGGGDAGPTLAPPGEIDPNTGRSPHS